MTRFLKSALLRTWMGAIGVIVSIAAAITIIEIWGPIWGEYGWRVVASGLMVLIFFAFVGLQELLRPPNPYSRLNPLYDMRDLGPEGELHSSDLSWLWNAIPLIAAAIILFLTA